MPDEKEDVNPEDEVDITFKPVIELDPVDVDLLEDDEDEVFTMRAKLFRFDSLSTEWKERGIGDIRMLQHKKTSRVRLLMRRDKVLKICCNHFLTKAMELKPHLASERAFVWTAFEKPDKENEDPNPKPETLAIRFRDAEKADAFKKKFIELQSTLPDETEDEDSNAKGDGSKKTSTTADDVTKKLEVLNVKENAGDS